MPEYSNENSGTLFKNDRKPAGSKQPDYRGKLNVDGRDLELAGWIKEGRAGKFVSLKVSEPYKRDDAPPPSHDTSREDDDFSF